MKKWLIVCLLVALGCGKKDKNNTDPDIGSDTGSMTDMSVNNANNSAIDMSVPEDTATPDPDMGPADMAVDMTPDAADMFEFPDVMQQNCAHPTTDPTCPMGEFGAGTFLSQIEIVQTETCCRDFDGDGTLDNQIGSYLPILQAAGADVNTNIAIAVQNGLLSYLFEYANWGNETFDPDLDFRVYLGADALPDFTDNLAGMGSFNVIAESFDANGDPKWPFDNVTVTNGRLVATDGELELFFPGLLDEVQMHVADVRIEADVIPPADLASGGGVTLQNGQISGVLLRNRFYESMNEAANACVCLQKNVLVYDANTDNYSCDVDPQDEMNCLGSGSGCEFLASRQACQFFQLASPQIDVDVDGDGVNDGFSVGVTFSGIPAEIVGRQ